MISNVWLYGYTYYDGTHGTHSSHSSHRVTHSNELSRCMPPTTYASTIRSLARSRNGLSPDANEEQHFCIVENVADVDKYNIYWLIFLCLNKYKKKKIKYEIKMDRTYAEFLAHITPWLPQIGSISLHIEQLLLEEIVIAHKLHDFRVLVVVVY